MGKRNAEVIEDGDQAYQKRQRISNGTKTSSTSIAIQSAAQLKQLLAFDQDAGRSRHGIQSFKAFIDTCAQSPTGLQVNILQEYLESQKPADDEDKSAVYLSDIIQTWSFASQANDESLLSAVPAVLARLLHTLSRKLEFTEYGLRLGRTLLQRRQLELIARSLSSNKSKEYIISPALRLLRELSTYDGGTLAKSVFRARDYTFKGLARNLGLRYTGDSVEDRSKPSVRTNALRFVLSMVQLLPTDEKRELLHQKDVVMALTKDIKDDPAFLIRETLETLKTSVLQNDALPRDSKSKIINLTSLTRIAALYGYVQIDEEEPKGQAPINEIAHKFLTLACTSPSLGALNRQNGFYPRGVDADENQDADTELDSIDLGLESIEWMEKFTEKIPVRNTILSVFGQSLRPWSSLQQAELLLSIFKSAPELVADYFITKKSFSLDPKLTATWIGYSAFVFSTVQLPIPQYFGHQERYARLPPPSSIVIESILPQPLTQKVFTRSLKDQPHNLISFFAIRILSVAFSKMQQVLKMYQEAAAASSSIWTQAAERLLDDFCKRVPSIKDVIFAYRDLSNTDLMQREAVTKLLVLYHEVTPRIALDAKFDVSDTLTQTLQAVESINSSTEDRAFRILELENLFQFAHFSPGMRWFSKVEALEISPFTAMLKLSAEAPSGIPLLKLQSVLASVVKENQIFQTQSTVSALGVFILRLKAIQGSQHEKQIYSFLDDCISRCAATPIKYIFLLEDMIAKVGEGEDEKLTVSLLIPAIAEQWPFLVRSENGCVDAVAEFVAQYFAASIKIGESKKILKQITKSMAGETPEGSRTRKAIEKSRKLVDDIEIPEPKLPATQSTISKDTEDGPSEIERSEVDATMVEELPKEDHNALVKWATKEIEEVIEGGHAAALIMLLSSEHFSVRKEALTNLSKVAAKLKESSYEEKDQIWLLLCELAETSRPIIDTEPLPTLISSFASHAIGVLCDPLHYLYPKINKFLSQGPTWEVDKIPLMHKILDESPSLDDQHYAEISWLLGYMLVGLRTSKDMAIFRKRRVFEKLMSLYNSPYLKEGLRGKILKLFFRATTIEGGSTTLITRFSSMTWLEAQVALGGGTPLKALMQRIMESSDKSRVEGWKSGVKTQKSEK
ncbi:ribosome biogenesis urb1 protein [Rutstroemia sp. NJR-2017a WRK4]|nr:ribosome biogenesis urb1 protein [Rutstroemia sp. NJR-2017a WRK4]